MSGIKKKKVSTLYERRLSGGYIAKTIIMFIMAALLWYMVCAIVPFVPPVGVSEDNSARVTKSALSASAEEAAAAEETKERALMLPSSEDGFINRLKLIESAERTIDFAVFENNNDEWIAYFYSAVLRAADRGVKVRLIFDGRIGKLDGEYKALQKVLQNHNNIELYLFNPLNLADPAGILVFMHDKLTIVDGDRMLVGGVNMGKRAYLRNADIEVMITNSDENRSVGQVRRYYDKLVKSGLAKRKKSKKCDFSVKEKFDKQYAEYIEKHKEQFGTPIDYSKAGIPVDKVTHLSNEINATKKQPIIWQAVCNLAEGSTDTTIVSPYLLLEDKKINKLRELADGSGGFRAITNSLYNTRNVAYAHYLYTRKDIVSDKLNLYEYQADNQLHAKSMSFDGRYTVIGSFNMDERSCHIDTESVVVIDSTEFNKQFNAFIESKFMPESLKVGADNKYIPSDTVPEKKVPFAKKARYRLFRALSVVINLL